MDTLALLGTALGLGLASGLSLYGTVFVTGLTVHLGWIRLATEWQGLDVLGDPVVLVPAGVLFAVELLADKIPWLDSLWDSVHTVIRPIGGALLATRVLGDLSPAAEVVAFLLLGGVTLTAHGAKAGFRLLVNTSPEPFSNGVVSLSENVLVGTGVWLALAHPLLALVVGLVGLAACVAVTLWLGRRLRRALRGGPARA
jgi:hypothetical protein